MSASPGLAVLDLVRRHLEEADVVARWNEHDAETMRKMAAEYEAAVKGSMPEWWSLHAVQAARPWSMKALRRRARELAESRKARRGKNGHWEIRWDAVLEIPAPPVKLSDVDPEDEKMLDELALG